VAYMFRAEQQSNPRRPLQPTRMPPDRKKHTRNCCTCSSVCICLVERHVFGVGSETHPRQRPSLQRVCCFANVSGGSVAQARDDGHTECNADVCKLVISARVSLHTSKPSRPGRASTPEMSPLCQDGARIPYAPRKAHTVCPSPADTTATSSVGERTRATEGRRGQRAMGGPHSPSEERC